MQTGVADRLDATSLTKMHCVSAAILTGYHTRDRGANCGNYVIFADWAQCFVPAGMPDTECDVNFRSAEQSAHVLTINHSLGLWAYRAERGLLDGL